MRPGGTAAMLAAPVRPAGLDKIGFQGRLSRIKNLAAGNYGGTVVSHGGNTSNPLNFTILP